MSTVIKNKYTFERLYDQVIGKEFNLNHSLSHIYARVLMDVRFHVIVVRVYVKRWTQHISMSFRAATLMTL